MKFVLLSVFLVVVSAFPHEFKLNVHMLDKAIERLKKYPQYIPNYVMEQINTATDEEKEQFVDFVNKLDKGEYKMDQINTSEDLVKLIEKEAPAVGAKARIIQNEYMDRLQKVTPQAQEFLAKWEKTWFTNIQQYSGDKQAFFKQMIELIPQLMEEVQGFTEETWNSLREQFPEQTAAWKDHEDRLKQFYEFIKSLPKQQLAEDPEAFRKFAHLGLQKLLLSEALKA